MYVNLCNVVRNASVLFSVVPLSHNCGTKITLISINKAKSYQHLQRLKSVSVNDLAIDVFGCFWVLFSDALSCKVQIVNKIGLRFQQNRLKVNTNIVLYQNLVKDTILQI